MPLGVLGHRASGGALAVTSSATSLARGRLARSLLLCGLFAAGLGLRLVNVNTMTPIGDERHIVEDSLWSRSNLAPGAKLHFLRHHQGDHKRLNPVSGELRNWSDVDLDRWGHPPLALYVAGAVLWVVPPDALGGPIRVVRAINAVADSTTILLLPALVTVLGGGSGAGLAAAALYALLPAAATFAAIANIDPLMAPLMVLLCILIGAPSPSPSRFAWAGLVTGLLVASKETGLVAIALVPLASLWLHGRHWRALLLWVAAAAATTVLLLDPIDYVLRVAAPEIPGSSMELSRLGELGAKLLLLLDASQHGWLGFARHGHPLAPLFARAHAAVNAAFVLAALGALGSSLVRRRVLRFALVWLPVALAFAILPADAGLPRRMHLVIPLVCAGIACELSELSWRMRAVALALCVVIGASVLLPQRPAQGRVDLADLIRANPPLELAQPIGFYKPWEGRHLELVVPNSVRVERSLFLRPGRYRIRIEADAALEAEIDGQRVEANARPVPVLDLTGWTHRLVLGAPEGALVHAVTLRRVGDSLRE